MVLGTVAPEMSRPQPSHSLSSSREKVPGRELNVIVQLHAEGGAQLGLPGRPLKEVRSELKVFKRMMIELMGGVCRWWKGMRNTSGSFPACFGIVQCCFPTLFALFLSPVIFNLREGTSG